MPKKNTTPVNDDGWKNADPGLPDLFAFVEEGDQVIGVLSEIKSVTTDFGEGRVATLIDPESGAWIAFFMSAALQRIIDHRLLGKLIRVTYLGFQINEKTGREYKDFQVDYKESAQAELPIDQDDPPF